VASDERHRTHLQIGVIARPHGVRGELKVHLHFEDSTALQECESVVVEPTQGKAQRYSVESLRGSAKGPILALAGVQGREAADALRGAKLWVERDAVEPLAEGEYFLVDLPGSEVEYEGEVIATVTGVRPDPSVDTMLVEMKDGTAAEIPILDIWVGDVDTDKKRVQLLSLDGIIS
jgi:16S rRNA processing protein RimM